MIVGVTRAMEVPEKKMYKSKNRNITKCYSCKYIGHCKRDYPNRKHGSSSYAIMVQTVYHSNEANILFVSSRKCKNEWIFLLWLFLPHDNALRMIHYIRVK